MIVFLFATTAIYILIISSCLYLLIESEDESEKTIPSLPEVSIIIAARNEENNLPACLTSLLKLDYPPEKIQIIFIDDRSEDNTAKLLEVFCKNQPDASVINIEMLPPDTTGKINALRAGTARAAGDLFFFTDADCCVPTSWLKGMIKHFDDTTGIVAGSLAIKAKRQYSSLFIRMQALDWSLFCSCGTAAARAGRPLSIFGNNFCIKREVFQKAGGFENVPIHHTEDYALFQNVTTLTGQKTKMLLNKSTLVHTFPESDFRNFLKQRLRWAAGAKKRGLISSGLILTGLTALFAILINLIYCNILSAVFSLSAVIIIEGLLLRNTYKKLDKKFNWLDILTYKLFQLLYLSIIILPVIFKIKINWKGRDLKI